MEKKKVLIIRFSSFGDIVQCSTVVELLAHNFSNIEIDWITRNEFTELVSLNENILRVFPFNRKDGLKGLIKKALFLRKQNYDFVYDAHNNVRSNIIFLIFKLLNYKGVWITRSKDRWKRFKLFKLRINDFPKPFKGIDSFQKPLIEFGLNNQIDQNYVKYKFKKETQNKIDEIIDKKFKVITLVPSAAWEMKRWPISYWQEIVKKNDGQKFYLLGGKEDTFCEEIKSINPENCINLAGKLSLIESTCFIANSDIVISADTGLLHVADVLGVKGLSLMGPTAFGFTTGKQIKTLEVDLPCRPCTKDGSGKCNQSVYKKCMIDITPNLVNKELSNILSHLPK